MVFVIDDKRIAELSTRYRRMMRDTPYLRSRNLGNNQPSNEKYLALDAMEKMFTIYGIVKEHAAKYGSDEFSGNYGLFCGSAYSDSILEQYAKEPLPISTAIRIPTEKSEVLVIAKLLEYYQGIISMSGCRNIPALTRGFFQGVNYETEHSLRKFEKSLEEISKEEIEIGRLKFKGLDYNGKHTTINGKYPSLQPESMEKEESLSIEPVQFYEKISFDDIGGNHAAKEAARSIIEEIKNPAVRSFYGKKKGRGILLYGPPGTGKTMLAKAIACEINKPMYEVLVEKILDKWLGNSEKRIAELLNKRDVIFFFDEFDSLGRKKDEYSHEVTTRITNLIATKIDGMNSDDSNTYIAATNNPLLIDQKLIRRFNRPIYMGVPDKQELQEIFQKQINAFRQRSDAWKLHKIDVFANIQSALILDAMYRKSQELQQKGIVGIVGSDIEEIINRAIEKAMKDAYSGNARLLTSRDFLEEIDAFKKISPWINAYKAEAINA